MMTKQNDTAAMTEEQLDAVSGGPHYTNWGCGMFYRNLNRNASLVSAESNNPSPSPRMGVRYVSISPVPNPTV